MKYKILNKKQIFKKGDTDSIMINTNTNMLGDALVIGKKIKD